jgi:hypothetical protein
MRLFRDIRAATFHVKRDLTTALSELSTLSSKRSAEAKHCMFSYCQASKQANKQTNKASVFEMKYSCAKRWQTLGGCSELEGYTVLQQTA